MYCTKCGANITEEDTKFCSKCGSPIEANTEKSSNQEEFKAEPQHLGALRKPEWKSEGTTLILTIILGIFGFGGIGHIYLGNITRGITILIVGVILLIVSIFTFGIGLIILIPFAIWVVFDARKQCRYYNQYVEQTGKTPW